jgi:3-hydroxyisobutyrate dehydrogenase-like beta-hydroxyacid dehydrogenase
MKGTVACIAEALALARAFGLDTRRLPAALAGGLADSNLLREYARGGQSSGVRDSSCSGTG